MFNYRNRKFICRNKYNLVQIILLYYYIRYFILNYVFSKYAIYRLKYFPYFVIDYNLQD